MNEAVTSESGLLSTFGPSVADLSPAYFGLVMATGIVSLSAFMLGHRSLASALFHLNVVQYAALWLLYGLRAWRHPRRFFGDMVAHLTGPVLALSMWLWGGMLYIR